MRHACLISDRQANWMDSDYYPWPPERQVGFNYKMELVHDNNYGALNLTTNKWNGLVRVFPSVFCKSFRSALSTSAKNNSIIFQELMENTGDIAVGAMTINYARENVIDFTKPFMNLGISILFKVIRSFDISRNWQQCSNIFLSISLTHFQFLTIPDIDTPDPPNHTTISDSEWKTNSSVQLYESSGSWDLAVSRICL